MLLPTIFDVLVIGGGHAGCEAAAAAARSGAKTLLLTHSLDAVGQMSCNPSFGGIGKGHLIREVDALDGVCARICDSSAITYHALNRSAGPAVLGLRAQIDRKLYKQHMQTELFQRTPGLEVRAAEVDDLILEDGRGSVGGVVLSNGERIPSKSVVLATGTFLGAEIWRGAERWQAGRIGEKSSIALASTLARLGLKMGRLRTGTPPRILLDSVDLTKFEVQPPDESPIPFSFMTENVWIPVAKQLPTYRGETNDRVAQLVQRHMGGNDHIRAEITGPRYCPSLEAKVARFPHLQHRIFLEHEGLDSNLLYPQGMSMTLPTEIQLEVLRSIRGMENVQVAEWGYGVAYDFVDPRQLERSLELKPLKGLFLAGQINGTTGYEEAAAQGILAGANAAAAAQGREPIRVDRSQGYIGVLVDDLTSLGTNEPYRMFTSRAECRLHLRPDNADMRLTELGRRSGIVGDPRWRRFSSIKSATDDIRSSLQSAKMPLAKWTRLIPRLSAIVPTTKLANELNAYELLYRRDVSLDELVAAKVLTQLPEGHEDVERRLRIEASYAAVEVRQQQRVVAFDRVVRAALQMADLSREAATPIPENLDFRLVGGLSEETVEQLERGRPATLGAATRLPSVTPDASLLILHHIKRRVSVGASA